MATMKKAAVACDNWKLPVFEEALKKAGYDYKVAAGEFPKGCKVISVQTRTVAELKPIIEKANDKARSMKKELKRGR